MTGRDRLDRWIAARKKEAGRLLALEEALLGGTFFRYAARRLTTFGLARSVGIFFHVVELVMLSEIFAARAFVASIALQNVMLVVDAFFWGALEAMRRRVRELGPGAEASVIVTRWLGAALRLAVLAVIVPGGLLFFDVYAHGGRSILLHIYAVVCGLRLGVDAVVRTYYSGVFAHTRVHRPLWSTVVGPGFLLGTTVLLWEDYAGFAFPIALVLSTAASRSLLFLFSRRGYERHQVVRPSFRLALRRPRIERSSILPAVTAGIANATSRIGGIVLLAAVIPSLVRLDFDDGGGLEPFSFSLHLAAPFLLLASQWAFVFYHDHKRLESSELRLLGRHFHRRMLVLAGGVAVVAWILTVAFVLALVPWAEARSTLLALLPAMFGLSFWTAVQLQGFTRGEFATQAAGALAVIGSALLVLTGMKTSAGETSWYLALSIGPWLAIAIHALVGFRRRRLATGQIPTFAGWLAARSGVKGPTSTWRAQGVDRDAEVARRIAEVLGERGAVVRAGGSIFWFERGPASPKLRWLTITGGLATTIERDPDTSPMAKTSFDELCSVHAALFPKGFVLRIGDRAPDSFLALDAAARQGILREGLKALRGGRTRTRHAVTPWAPDGVLDALFVRQRPVDPGSARKWAAALPMRVGPPPSVRMTSPARDT